MRHCSILVGKSLCESCVCACMLINGLPSLETCRVKRTTDVVYLLPGKAGMIKYQTPFILQMYGNEPPGRG